MYKIYGNGLFDRLQIPSLGCRIGEISCVAPGCADDVAILAENKRILQRLVDIAVDYSGIERYLLQPIKSVLLEILQNVRRSPPDDTVVTMKEQPMPIVEEVMHRGSLDLLTLKKLQSHTIFRKQDAQYTALWDQDFMEKTD